MHLAVYTNDSQPGGEELFLGHHKIHLRGMEMINVRRKRTVLQSFFSNFCQMFAFEKIKKYIVFLIVQPCKRALLFTYILFQIGSLTAVSGVKISHINQSLAGL